MLGREGTYERQRWRYPFLISLSQIVLHRVAHNLGNRHPPFCRATLSPLEELRLRLNHQPLHHDASMLALAELGPVTRDGAAAADPTQTPPFTRFPFSLRW
jgi:hypothetical protein